MRTWLLNLFEQQKVRSRYKPMHEITDMIIAEFKAKMPTEEECEKYANGNFGYDNDATSKEQAFISGCDWFRNRMKGGEK